MTEAKSGTTVTEDEAEAENKARLREHHNHIALTISRQLGGNRFVVMTGASMCTTTAPALPGLSVRFSNPNRTKANYCLIELNAKDLYDVTFSRHKRPSIQDIVNDRPTSKQLARHTDVYAEDLRRIFEAETDLRTSL